jgi:cyclic pyranopterin phosphate synthase
VTRLVDPHGRVLRKLRVSVTDACNQRCTYCMPQAPIFTPMSRLLRPSEYRSICSRLVALGIEELRVTGGEPTVRPEFRHILAALSDVGASRLGVTSNGQLLGRHLEFLRDTGWIHLNISLDSLDPGAYDRITGGGDHRAVLRAIGKADAMGLRVKVNVVVLRGINDGELPGFADWSARTGIEVRFLELMRIGPGAATYPRRFMSAAEMMERLARAADLVPVPMPPDSTARVFKTSRGGRLGFIASESMPFCGSCSRLRLSATGMLRACLMQEGGRSLRDAPPEEFPGRVAEVAAMKPVLRPEKLAGAMHAVGG